MTNIRDAMTLFSIDAGGPGSGRHAVMQLGKKASSNIRNVQSWHPDKKTAMKVAERRNGELMPEEAKQWKYQAVPEEKVDDYLHSFK